MSILIFIPGKIKTLQLSGKRALNPSIYIYIHICMYLNKILHLEMQLLSQENCLGIPFLTALFFSQNSAVLNFPILPNCRASLIFICVFLGCALVLWKPLNLSNPIFSTAAWLNPPGLQKLDISPEVQLLSGTQAF